MNKKQSGLTMISWMVVIGFLAVQIIMGLRIVPVYINYHAVKSVMDSLPIDPDIKGKSAKNIKKVLSKRLKIENLYDLARDKEAFKFKKIKGGYNLTAHYESRGPIMGNLEFVATFDHQVDILTK
ncbi:hypothetical protein MNBD_GAMMA11-1222 [hydrothermal vent metagenome]|uniref:DUF4845 domain-containing protein n=1 Tax=hydrothermal vent metagenome TaxID=652676 RepID=A0A3B0XMN3_9ZZZZ